MRSIKKGAAPRHLIKYQSKPGAVYDGENFTPVKNAIRAQLLREQGHLCAYCMKRIELDTMKVEHWRCQDNYPTEQLDYRNMLGVCFGNEGLPLIEQTCDTHKGNSDIKYNPASPSPSIESSIRYTGDGKIESDDPDFNLDLNKVLNLNRSSVMQGNRKAVHDAINQVLGRQPGRRKKSEIKKLIKHWNSTGAHNRLEEFCGVAIYYLKKHPSY